MHKKFEVPYNFSKSLILYYKSHAEYISYIFLPPYKEDSLNTRTSIETKRKGYCYMPQTRDEYESHLLMIEQNGLSFVILWQEPSKIITHDKIAYYEKLGASGFIIGNDNNASIIKQYNSKLLVIGSLVQRFCKNITKMDFTYYDYIILYYPFNRAIEVLKHLGKIKEKVVIMPNTFCHVDCPSIHHWFPQKEKPFIKEKDCPIINNPKNAINYSGFIAPEHLFLFDKHVSGYKLEGRELSTTIIINTCNAYFYRENTHDYLRIMLGDKLSEIFVNNWNRHSIEEYYNKKSKFLVSII